jgi:shikimate dehydrogenase
VIGHPVSHSRSPFIHQAFAAQFGHRLRYERLHAAPGSFRDVLSAFRAGGGAGANVTLPFKVDAFETCDRKSARARAAGAVNTLVLNGDTIEGDNTDGIGLVNDIEGRLGLKLAGLAVLVLGAGGACRGVLGPLREAGCTRLVVANRSLARAADLKAEVCGFEELAARFLSDGPWDLVVNATSAGLAAHDLPIDVRVLAEAQLAYDMVYAAQPTPFLRLAMAAGCRLASDGLGMLVGQAAEAYRIWHGVSPRTAQVYAELRASLSREVHDDAAALSRS